VGIEVAVGGDGGAAKGRSHHATIDFENVQMAKKIPAIQ
jgi:hypothetical protein